VRICSGAGCLRAVADDVRYCDSCKPVTQHNTTSPTHTNADRERYAFLYSSGMWTKLRAVVIREQPMCQRCGLKLTAIIDHIVPAGVAIQQAIDSGKYANKYAGFYIRSNLQGLCRSCHLWKTIEDKTHVGVWINVVDKDKRIIKKIYSF
jgi:5-methylcytosine-specific restriction endonuclease McrA